MTLKSLQLKAANLITVMPLTWRVEINLSGIDAFDETQYTQLFKSNHHFFCVCVCVFLLPCSLHYGLLWGDRAERNYSPCKTFLHFWNTTYCTSVLSVLFSFGKIHPFLCQCLFIVHFHSLYVYKDIKHTFSCHCMLLRNIMSNKKPPLLYSLIFFYLRLKEHCVLWPLEEI